MHREKRMCCVHSLCCVQKLERRLISHFVGGPPVGSQDDYMDVLLVDLLAHVMVHVGKSTRKRDRWDRSAKLACLKGKFAP